MSKVDTVAQNAEVALKHLDKTVKALEWVAENQDTIQKAVETAMPEGASEKLSGAAGKAGKAADITGDVHGLLSDISDDEVQNLEVAVKAVETGIEHEEEIRGAVGTINSQVQANIDRVGSEISDLSGKIEAYRGERNLRDHFEDIQEFDDAVEKLKEAADEEHAAATLLLQLSQRWRRIAGDGEVDLEEMKNLYQIFRETGENRLAQADRQAIDQFRDDLETVAAIAREDEEMASDLFEEVKATYEETKELHEEAQAIIDEMRREGVEGDTLENVQNFVGVLGNVKEELGETKEELDSAVDNFEQAENEAGKAVS